MSGRPSKGPSKGPSEGSSTGSSLWLCVAVLLAALGTLLAAPPAYTIAGTAIALVLWDFSSARRKGYLRSRLPYALASTGLGALVAIIGVGMPVALPFFAMILCVLACAFCIDRVARIALTRNSRDP